jgi:endoglucanase
MDKNKISYINWSIGNKGESSSALQTGTGPNDVCTDSRDTQSGQFVKSMLRKKNPTVPAVCPAGEWENKLFSFY